MSARWEWRVFAPSLSAVRARLAAEMGGGSDERQYQFYLVGPCARRNVKAQEHGVDVKTLVETERGLERWRPDGCTPFPLPAEWVRQALPAHLDLGPIAVDEPMDDRDTLVRRVVGPHPEIDAVAVRKQRRRHACGDVLAEHAALIVAGVDLETAAVEGEDADLVLEWVARLGLDAWPNESWVRRLQKLLGRVYEPLESRAGC